MSDIQTEMGSPKSLVSKFRSLAKPSTGVKSTIESLEKMPTSGAKDILESSVSYKYQYESKLAGNEGDPLTDRSMERSEHYAFIVLEPTRYEKDLQPYINAYGPSLRIPVSPSTLAINRAAAHNEVQSIMFGGVLERNAPGLRSFAISSFIPATPYYLGRGDYGFQNYYPWNEDMGDGKRKITNGTLKDDNLCCTQQGWISFVNLLMNRRIILKFHLIKAPTYRHRQECMLVCIRNFTYAHNPHDDLDYTLELVEWREPAIRIGEEQIIKNNEDDAPKPPKNKSGGKILLVMHELQGVNTVVLNPRTERLLALYGLKMSTDASASITQLTITTNWPIERNELKKGLSEFIPTLKHTTDEKTDYRKTKLTHVSLGTIPQGSYSSLNITGIERLSLSQLTEGGHKKALEQFKQILSLKGSLTESVSIDTNVLYTDTLLNVIKRNIKSLQSSLERKIRETCDQRIKEIINSLQYLEPPPLKLYDGGQTTGFGEKGDTIQYDGTLNAYEIPKVSSDPTSGQFTANNWYDTSSNTMGINRSGLHKMVIDETGLVRYDDLVRRVLRRNIKTTYYHFDVSMKVRKIGVIETSSDKHTVSVTIDYQAGYVWNDNASEYKYAVIDTVGAKLHKGQRFMVLDSHLRPPTKTELEWARHLNSANARLKR